MRPPLPLAVAGILVVLTACHPPRRQPVSHHETRAFPAAAGKVVRCKLRSLGLEVHVRPQDDIQVTVDLEASSSSAAAARRWLERHTPTFEDSAPSLGIAVPPTRGGSLAIGSLRTKGRLVLTLPPQCKLVVESTSGDIRIDGGQPLAGPVRLQTASGDVEVRGGVDDLVMRTASGDLEVRSRALRSLEFTSASGDARVRDGCGNVIVDSSSGDIRLARLAGTLSATTSSGDVAASWIEPPTRIVVTTSSGDVSLELPAGTVLRGEARTRSGHIRSAFRGVSDQRGQRLAWSGPAEACAVDIGTSSGDVRLGRSGEATSERAATPAPEAEPRGHTEI